MLKIYNTLSKKKQIFKPLENNKIGIYTCGPTVYDFAHIGNLRAFIFADVLVRSLKYNNFHVKWVMNITDVDDKTIKGAKRKYPQLKPMLSLKKFTQFYEKFFWQDLKKLNIQKPNYTPKATQTIKEIQNLIKNILIKDYAYIKNNSIYFNVKKYVKNYQYGQMVKINLKKLKTNNQIEADEYEKEDVQDFALWKAKKNKEPFWNFKIKEKNYPGRPGWHIECSAMSKKYLGIPFDIHNGGVDLKFPHHENEIAQNTIGYNCSKPVNFWLHNGHVLIKRKRMAKRFKNFYILNDLIKKKINPLSFRYLCLTSHYRSPLNFSWKSLKASQNALNNLYKKTAEIKSLPLNPVRKDGWIGSSNGVKIQTIKTKIYQKRFLNLINNDLDTAKALALMWQMINDKNLLDKEKYALLLNFDKVLGLNLAKIKKLKIPQKIKELVKKRQEYRKNNNWKKADEIREKIKKIGWEIKDTKNGSLIIPIVYRG